MGRLDYLDALELQARLVVLRQSGRIQDIFVLAEHGHTYTVGRRANPSHLLLKEHELERRGIRFYAVDRGGEMTYHGPGQLVGYPIIKVGGLPKIRDYLHDLEKVLIGAAADFGVSAGRLAAHPGVWAGSKKLAAIGLRVTRSITKHGFALNVSTELAYFNGIIPCGLRDKGVTSLSEVLGRFVDMPDAKASVIENFGSIFNADLEPITRSELLGMAKLAVLPHEKCMRRLDNRLAKLRE